MTKREKELIGKINSAGPLEQYTLSEKEGRIFRRLARKGLVVGFDTSPRLWRERWRKLKSLWDRKISRIVIPILEFIGWLIMVTSISTTITVMYILISARELH